MKVEEVIGIVCVGREKLLTVNECHKVVESLWQGEKNRKILNKLKKMHDPICFGDERFMDLCDYISNLEEE